MEELGSWCDVREVDGVFYVSGELDGPGGDVLRNAVTPALSEDRTHLVLEVSKVTFIDSMGFSAIAMLAVGLTDGVVVRSPQRSVTRLFDVIRAKDMPGIHIERG